MRTFYYCDECEVMMAPRCDLCDAVQCPGCGGGYTKGGQWCCLDHRCCYDSPDCECEAAPCCAQDDTCGSGMFCGCTCHERRKP